MQLKVSIKSKIALTAIYMSLILATSIIPMGSYADGFPLKIDINPTIQNLLHIPMFGILAILFLKDLNKSDIKIWKKNILVIFMAGSFGAMCELIQLLIPGRFGNLMDIGLNFIGTILGICLFMVCKEPKHSHIKKIISK